MTKFSYTGDAVPELRGRVFTMAERLTLGETRYVENLVGRGVEHMTFVEQMATNILLSLRRLDPKLLGWEEMQDIPVEDFEVEDEPPPVPGVADEIPDPTDAVTPTARRSWSQPETVVGETPN
jgi:hypothetical protein